jgi:hypothetical protein
MGAMGNGRRRAVQAGASIPPTSVVATQIGHLRLEAAVGGYDAAAQAQKQLDAVYTSTCRLLSAPVGSIALVDSSTTAFAKAIYSLNVSKGDVLLSVGESECVSFEFWFVLRLQYALLVHVHVLPVEVGALRVEVGVFSAC